jgi:hypothetical protein
MILEIRSWLNEILKEILEGFGGYNNTMQPNENISKQRELKEQQEIQDWRNRLKEDYKKENINLKTSKLNLFSLLENIITILVYNLVNISIMKLITVIWNVANTFITSDITPILTLDPTILEASITPNLFFFRRITKNPYIHPDVKLAQLALDELFDIKDEKEKRRIIKNARIILNQIFIYCNKFQPIKPHLLDRIHDIMPSWDIGRLMQEVFRGWTSNKYIYLKSNIANKNLRYYVLFEIIRKYWDLVSADIEREELIRTIKLQLTTEKQIFYKTKPKPISQSRKYHTSTQTIECGDETNWKQLSWVIFLILRIIGRLVCYVVIINNMFYISPINLSLTGPISFGDELANALTEAQDEAQDAYHEAAEIEAEYQNTEVLMQDLSNVTGQSVPQLTQQLISENSNLFDPDEIVETSTPNIQAPNNTLESNDEMETDMEIYINSPDSDVESNNTLDVGDTNNDSDTENSSFVDDSILNSDLDSDSNIGTDTEATSISDDSEDSDMEMELDIIQEMDAEDSDVDIAELFIPLIFFLSNKFSWHKILITIFLIILRIILSYLDVSQLVDLSLSDTTLIIDMNLDEYKTWFDSFSHTDKPLPELPLIELSIFPFFFLRNPILDKIIKDVLKLIYQYLINLITSILVNKANTVLLSVGVFGLFKIHKKDKGKGKEVEYIPKSESDSEVFSKIESNDSYIDPSDGDSINSTDTLASYEKYLDQEVKEALDEDFARERLESEIKRASRKSYITEFLTKAKITPTRELQAEMARVLQQIQKDREYSSISSGSDLTDSTNTNSEVGRYNSKHKGKQIEKYIDWNSSIDSTFLDSNFKDLNTSTDLGQILTKITNIEDDLSEVENSIKIKQRDKILEREKNNNKCSPKWYEFEIWNKKGSEKM